MLWSGKGVAVDQEEAQMWFNKAKSQGNLFADAYAYADTHGLDVGEGQPDVSWVNDSHHALVPAAALVTHNATLLCRVGTFGSICV